MSQLSVMFPAVERVEVSGVSVRIHAVKLRHFEEYGRHVGELIKLLAAGRFDEFHAYGETNARALHALLRHNTSLSRWQLWGASVAFVLQVMLQVIRVNADFFAQAQAAGAQLLAGLMSL